MKKTAKFIVPVCVAAMLAGWLLKAADAGSTNKTGATAPAADSSAEKLVAKGKGVQVTRNQLDDEVIRLKAGIAARGQVVPPEELAMLEKRVLQGMVQVQMLLSKATEADKTAGKEAAVKRMADTKTALGSDEALDRQLKLASVTREQLIAKWTEAATAEAVLKRELGHEVTDEEAKKYYEDHPAEFEQPERVRAAHVLIATKDLATMTDLPEAQKTAKRKQIDDLLKRARAGEDFAKLAKEYSDDTGSKENGGEYTFARASADPAHAMAPEFEIAAFSLKTNQISDVVTTAYGYHIIKLNEKIPAKKMEYSTIAKDLKDYLSADVVKKNIPEFMAKLEKDAAVEILDPALKMPDFPPAMMPPPSAPATRAATNAPAKPPGK